MTFAPRDAKKRLSARPRPPVPPTTAIFAPLRSRLEGSTRCHARLLSLVMVFLSLLAFFLVRNILSIVGMSRPAARIEMGRPKEVTDEEIVVVARRFFLDRGAGVSVHDIAKELGVTHTTLFNRFGSKEA